MGIEDDRAAIVRRAQTIDPNLGRVPTDTELAESLSFHPGSIGRIRRQEGVFYAPFPDVKPFKLGMNDKAFMLGMPYEGYKFRVVHWGGSEQKRLVRVNTESEDPKVRRFMDIVFKDLWVPNQNEARPGGFLDYDSAKFLLDPLQTFKDKEFFNSQFRYLPFLFCLMLLGMSPQGRLTFSGDKTGDRNKRQQEADLLKKVNDQCVVLRLRFGSDREPLPLGNYGVRKSSGSGYIELKEVGELLRRIFQGQGVQKLRIFRKENEDIETDPVQQLMKNFLPDALELAQERGRYRLLANNFFLESQGSHLGSL